MTLDANNTFLQAAFCIKAGLIPAVWGPPGVGKTSLTPALAMSLGFVNDDDDGDFYDREGYVTYSMAYTVLEDIAGLPVQGPDNSIVRLHDKHFVLACENKTFMVVDEANRFASQGVANVALKLFQERIVGNRPLHSKTAIMLLMNEVTSEGARELPPALANRVAHLAYVPDPMHFIDYLMGGKGAMPELPATWPDITATDIKEAKAMVAAFLRANPLKVYMKPKDTAMSDKPWGRDICGPWASNRTWDNFARIIALVGKFGDIRKPIYADIVHNIGLGTVGPVASEFHNFLTKSDLRSGAEVLDGGTYIIPRRIDILWAEVVAACVESRRRNTIEAWHRIAGILMTVIKQYPEVGVIALPYAVTNADGNSAIVLNNMLQYKELREILLNAGRTAGMYGK